MSTFENVIRKYSGTGQIEVDDNPQAACTFEAMQLVNGNIWLICQIENSVDPQFSCSIKLRGITNQGNPLILEGPGFSRLDHRTNSEQIRQTQLSIKLYGPTKIIIGDKNWSDEVEIRFTLTNLYFKETATHHVDSRIERPDTLILSIAEKQIQVYQLSDYEERIEMLRSIGGIDVTCEARIKLQTPDEIASICELMSNICLLLSLARGTLISWIFYEVVSSDDQVVFVEHQPHITRSYNPLIVIDYRPEITKKFVESTYKRFIQRDPIYHFRNVIHTYVTAKSNDIFLESRALVLISIVEYLVGTFVRNNNRKGDTFIEPEVFEEKKASLSEAIGKVVDETFAELDKEQFAQLRQSIVGKVQNFNNKKYSFEDKINGFVKDEKFTMPIDENDIEKFVKTRNCLVHEMKFQTETKDEQVGEYRILLHVLDKLLLGLLGYEGHYIDAMDTLA